MKKANHLFPILIISVLCFFSLIYNFHAQTLNMWDEATYANNAIDMMESPSLVIKHQGEIDLYNTKPPLVIALQAMCMKLFGVNTFSVRLPSILFSILTVFLLYCYSFKWFNKTWLSTGITLILLSTVGYIRNHVALTGDLDATLCFFLTAGFLQGIDIIIHKKTSISSMLLLSSFLILGFYSKGIAGIFHLPALLLLALLFHRRVFSHSKVYLIFTMVFVVCGLYYWARELAAPGYMQVVIDSEFSRVNSIVMDWQVRPFTFYWDNFLNGFLTPWVYLLPLGFSLLYKPKTYGKIALALLLGILFYFLLISYPKVKLDWYDAPLYPLIATFIGISSFHFLSLLIRNDKTKNLVFLLFLFVFAAPNLVEIIKTKLNTNPQVEALEFEGFFLHKLGKMEVSNKKISIYMNAQEKEHRDHVVFYERAMSEMDYQITYKTEPRFGAFEIVLVSQSK